MARQQAELERRFHFNRGLQVESNGLAHTQDVTRAFVFSYFELLQWLGIDISDIELLKMTKFWVTSCVACEECYSGNVICLTENDAKV